MAAGIPEGIVLIMLTGIGAVAWWGIRRIVEGQDDIRDNLAGINEKLAKINGRVGKNETRIETHERHTDERYREHSSEIDKLWAQVDRLRENHGYNGRA